MSSTVTTWGTDANTKATATTSVNDTFLRGYLPYIRHTPFYSNTDGDAVFIPFIDITENADNPPVTSQPYHRILIPYAGYIDKIVFKTNGSADTCDFEVYKAVSGTPGSDADENKLSATVSVEDGTANTPVTATFGTNYSFVAGDVIGIKMTFESSPLNVDISVVFKVLVD